MSLSVHRYILWYLFVCGTKGDPKMTNKKFKKAAMALALTACVAAAPLTANAESPENTADAQVPAAVDHADTDTAANAPETPEKKLPPPRYYF